MKRVINVDFSKQPTGNTCGPTCIYMCLKYVLNELNSLPFTFDIADTPLTIAEACGTDWVVGTPPDRMERGLRAVNLKYIEYQSSTTPFDLLRDVICNGNLPILRTITKGVPHWIIINGFVGNSYYVLDPWQGIIEYTENELLDIWAVRDFHFFEIITDDY